MPANSSTLTYGTTRPLATTLRYSAEAVRVQPVSPTTWQVVFLVMLSLVKKWSKEIRIAQDCLHIREERNSENQSVLQHQLESWGSGTRSSGIRSSGIREAGSELVEVKSELVEVESKLVELESGLVEMESELVELESELVEAD
ncbi:Protein CBG19456 [Caenorhabditis briggsae]|uniref:Protein CBG19456 n=1 Tax=Caenorhabditis briggsae TaxID=6238 RepID=A8XVP8_CAEBR|nr:Protein CBG19456 [Caenorhabditis briggsae]CAP36701.1 Protein CBG19456 [Caenorhabditis briggsae]